MKRSGRLAVVTASLVGLVGSALAGAQLAASQDDVVFASDFEDGTTQGWFGRGPAQVAVSTEEAHTGEASLLTTERAENWQGPGVDLLGVLQPGATYQVEGYVRLADAPTGTVTMTVQFTPTDGAQDWFNVVTDVPVTDDGWAQVSGSYTPEFDAYDEIQLYFESPDPAVSFYLDDVAITGAGAAGGDILISDDFEESLGGWGPRGADGQPTVSLTTEGDPRGTQSALVTDRGDAWHGIGHDVTTLFEPEQTYGINAWVKLGPDADPDVADIRVSVQRDADGGSSFDTVTTVNGVTADEWVEVSAIYSPGSFESALLYFETASGLSDFMIDDVVVTGTSIGIDPTIPDLWESTTPVPFGVAIDGRETVGPSSELVTKHFNQITPENHMKPVEIQPAEGEFTFGQADQLMQFAQDNGLNVYGHVLVWHSQVGEWMFQDPATGEPLTTSPADQELLRQRMITHIHAFADHFRDEFGEYGEDNPLVAIDVVNEVIAESEPDGLRRSEWYRILGPDFIPLAFHTAREAFGPDVMLYINDFNTEFPNKRQVYFDRISEWLDAGVPIDGVGHQLHLSLLQPISQIADSIELFLDLPVTQAVTELDVTINTSGEQWTTPPLERLIEQGYYYRDLFEVLREHLDILGAITVWGPHDARSWRAEGFPLLFDGNLQAKPAYWGIVDPDQLPTQIKAVNVHAGDVPLDGSATTAAEWELLPDVEVGSGGSGFQVRWAPDHLSVYVDVVDPTDNGSVDVVDLFWGDAQVTVARDGSSGGSAEVSSTADGYRVAAHLPVGGLAENDQVSFDLRITDGATGGQTSWNDLSHQQEDGERLGVLTMIEPVAYVEVPEASTAPAIDGQIDDVWDDAPAVTTDVQVEGSPGAFADVRLLWSDSALYLLAEVTDPQLDKGSSNAWEQDSVEFFVDPVNAKSGAYNPDDGQYRINFDNEVSFGATNVADRLTSDTSITDTGYVVEAAIDLGYEPEPGQLIGLELQVNDGTAGVRTSVRTWSDPTGRSFQSTERWGVARLVHGEDELPEEPVCDTTIDGAHTGPLRVHDTTCVTEGATVAGPVTVGTGAEFVVTGATITGPVKATGAERIVIHESRLTGPVTVTGTTGEVSLVGNQVIGPVRLDGNVTAPQPITVSANTIVGGLLCTGNDPEPDNVGEPNTVIGITQGQCRGL